MMKLFVQIPCLNEEGTLSLVIRDIPRQIDGVDEVKVLVIDDGSSDATSEVAYQAGADYVVRLPYTQGLARAFSIGINECLELEADIIVNIDGDNQYDGRDIPRLIQPIMRHRADMVIGDRTAANRREFTFIKRTLLALGSETVSFLSNVRVPDAASGFRAYSREAALRVNVFSKFSYTLETIIQAGKNHLVVTHVPIRTNAATRRSRLFGTTASYLKKSAATVLRIYTLYEPLRTLVLIGGLLFAVGAAGMLRFLLFWFSKNGGGHIQSLVVSAVFLIIGFQVWVIGILADLISVNRRLSEEVLYRMKRRETLSKGNSVESR
jgi:glycosyltransferase involved in cell wall biosynthesis